MLLLEYQTIGHLQEWSGESMEGLTLFSAGLRKSQMWDILNVRLWDYGGTMRLRPREWCNSITRDALCCALCREGLGGVDHLRVGWSCW